LNHERKKAIHAVMAVNWEQIFPEEDYRFHMGLRKGDAAQFYSPTPDHESLLDLRRRFLAEAIEEYCAVEPAGNELIEEVIDLAVQWKVLSLDDSRAIRSLSQEEGFGEGGPHFECRELARRLEPDFLLLRPDGEECFRLRGGAVCFRRGSPET
jgi:hypothetical protein